jgi:hypothetical protein
MELVTGGESPSPADAPATETLAAQVTHNVLGKRQSRDATLLDLPDDVLVRLLRILTEHRAQLFPATGTEKSSSKSPKRTNTEGEAAAAIAATATTAPDIRHVNERLLHAAAAAAPFAGSCRRVRALWRAPLARVTLCVRPTDRSERRIASVVTSLAPGLRALQIDGRCHFTLSSLFLALARCPVLDTLVIACDGGWRPDRAAVEWFLRARRHSLRVLRVCEPGESSFARASGDADFRESRDGGGDSSSRQRQPRPGGHHFRAGSASINQPQEIMDSAESTAALFYDLSHQRELERNPNDKHSYSPRDDLRGRAQSSVASIPTASTDPVTTTSGSSYIADIFSRGIVEAGVQSLERLDVPLSFVSTEDAHKLWHTLGPGIRSLSLVIQSCHARIRLNLDIVAVLSRACPNITKLAFGYSSWADALELERREALLGTLCRAYRQTLVSISMEGVLVSDPFALALSRRARYPHLTRVALLNCRWQSPATVRSVLTTLGPLVTKIRDLDAHHRGLGPLLRDHCPNLEELDIRTDLDWAIRGFRLDAYLGSKLKTFSFQGFIPLGHVVQGIHPSCRLVSLRLSCIRDAAPLKLANLFSDTCCNLRHLDLSGLSLPDLCPLIRVVQEMCPALEHFDMPLPPFENDHRCAGLHVIHDNAIGESHALDDVCNFEEAERALADALDDLGHKCPVAHVSDHRAAFRHEAGDICSPSKKSVARTMFASFLGADVAGPHV